MFSTYKQVKSSTILIGIVFSFWYFRWNTQLWKQFSFYCDIDSIHSLCYTDTHKTLKQIYMRNSSWKTVEFFGFFFVLGEGGGVFCFVFFPLPVVANSSCKEGGDNLNREIILYWNVLVNICFSNKNHLFRVRISKGSGEYWLHCIIYFWGCSYAGKVVVFSGL